MVGKGAEAIGVFSELTKGEAKSEYASLHALWGLGQLYRQGVEGSADPIVDALSSKEPEVQPVSPGCEIRPVVERAIFWRLFNGPFFGWFLFRQSLLAGLLPKATMRRLTLCLPLPKQEEL